MSSSIVHAKSPKTPKAITIDQNFAESVPSSLEKKLNDGSNLKQPDLETPN